MGRPTIYYGNLFSLGVLSGTEDTADNPVRRIADGSVNLRYTLTSTVASRASGEVEVTLTTAAAPDALVLVSGGTVSGHRWILESEDVGGGNNATILDFTISAQVDRFVREISGATARRVWRLTVSGVSGVTTNQEPYEIQLGTKHQLPRSPEVGVARERVRQFTRVPIPGGQPFVKRDGPRLRRTTYRLVVLSGSEVTAAEDFVDAVQGGQAFTIVDDQAAQYYAELLRQDIPFPDEAGVYRMEFMFQETRADQ